MYNCNIEQVLYIAKEARKMKIELWSDYACPFCYIGEKRLEKALAEIDGGDKVEIEFKSFELDPYASREVVSSTVDRFAAKYHLSKEEAAERIEAIGVSI